VQSAVKSWATTSYADAPDRKGNSHYQGGEVSKRPKKGRPMGGDTVIKHIPPDAALSGRGDA